MATTESHQTHERVPNAMIGVITKKPAWTSAPLCILGVVRTLEVELLSPLAQRSVHIRRPSVPHARIGPSAANCARHPPGPSCPAASASAGTCPAAFPSWLYISGIPQVP